MIGLSAGLLFACGSGSNDSNVGGNGNNGGSAGQREGTAGTSGSAASLAGTPSAGGAGDVNVNSPYDGLTVKPDTDTTPAASCAGRPDMTLCKIVTSPDRDYDICVGGSCVSPGCGDISCNPSAPHFATPPNSNHKYLQLQAGDEPVVIDLVTGLHWQSCMAGDTGAQCTGIPLTLNWSDALQFCEDSSWAGKTDWYLPDPWETLSILDWAVNGPLGTGLDPAFFPDGGPYPWTNTLMRKDAAIATQLRGGAPVALPAIVDSGTDQKHTLRCARRGFSRDAGFTDQRFSTSGTPKQKVIADAATGLLWQGCSSGASGASCNEGERLKVAVADFVGYCEDLSWSGFDDWRLPTYKELHSIVVYPPIGRSYPEIQASVFDLQGGSYLAARTGNDSNAKMTLIQVDKGVQIGPTGTYPVLCVRWK